MIKTAKKGFKEILVLTAVLVAALSGCSLEKLATCELFAMDTVMTISAYGRDASGALEKAEEEIMRLDRLFSITGTEGDIVKLNSGETGEVSDETAELVLRAVEISDAVSGAFDITVYPLSELWGFYSDDMKVPESEAIAEKLRLVGSDRLIVDGNSILLQEGTKIDLGGIAKGYTSSRVADILRENGVNSAIISLGGNVHALGEKPDGSDWRVAIASPLGSSEYAGVVEVSDKAVITSGGYQRNFEQDGAVYHHILDPKTGYPAESGLLSVTIIGEDDTLADALSTALFVMGEEKAVDFWKSSEYAFDMILITEDMKVLVSKGVWDAFSVYGEYETEEITK